MAAEWSWHSTRSQTVVGSNLSGPGIYLYAYETTNEHETANIEDLAVFQP